MSAQEHPSYQQEAERLQYTMEYMDQVIKATDEYKTVYKANIKEAYVNLDYLDSSLSYANIMLNTKFLEMTEKSYDGLKRTRKKPYFARIDVKTVENQEGEALYIGKTSLFRAEDNKSLIVDWRSPIANVYYEGRLGEVTYQSVQGIESIELTLKRQFTICDGQLENIMDIDITATDAFLQAALEASADDRLKDIASTIQSEQNRVIRADMDRPLIVQGAAGSGKTTIALHRIAYFIYTYEHLFDPENFMIMAPNNLFINYISEVLPELGVERVKQTTYIDLVLQLIGKQYKLLNPDEKLTTLIHAQTTSEPERELIKRASAFKGSMACKQMVDRYVNQLEISFTPKTDFAIRDHVLMTADEIEEMFLKQLYYLPLYKRINEIKKTLSNRLKMRKKLILEQMEAGYDQQIDHLRYHIEPSEQRRQEIIVLLDERDETLAQLQREMKTAVKKYLDTFPKGALFEYYEQLMTTEENIAATPLEESLSKNQISYLCSTTKKYLEEKKIEIEDCAALLYLKHRVFGFDKKMGIKNIVIDEAQDFSVFQLYALREVLDTNMFTLLGDLSQSIHGYRSLDNWEEVLNHVFPASKGNYMTLEQSYRTTIEVMNLANEVIKKLDHPRIVLAKPVIRHGNTPELWRFSQESTLIQQLQDKIQDVQKEKYKSIALICKTNEECMKVKKDLDKCKKVKTQLLSEKVETYEAGVVIVPIHLAKGLEFDVVFIINLHASYEEDPLDIKLLYVAMTRPLHQLYIYHIEGTLPIMNHISCDFYNTFI